LNYKKKYSFELTIGKIYVYSSSKKPTLYWY